MMPQRERSFLGQYDNYHRSDAEGAGALFRVSTLDFANLSRTPEGAGFFGLEAFLTVSGQLNI
jgi:asparaginyl-tRNA synthetase